jgi:hypothetical protein
LPQKTYEITIVQEVLDKNHFRVNGVQKWRNAAIKDHSIGRARWNHERQATDAEKQAARSR